MVQGRHRLQQAGLPPSGFRKQEAVTGTQTRCCWRPTNRFKAWPASSFHPCPSQGYDIIPSEAAADVTATMTTIKAAHPQAVDRKWSYRQEVGLCGPFRPPCVVKSGSEVFLQRGRSCCRFWAQPEPGPAGPGHVFGSELPDWLLRGVRRHQ